MRSGNAGIAGFSWRKERRGCEIKRATIKFIALGTFLSIIGNLLVLMILGILQTIVEVRLTDVFEGRTHVGLSLILKNGLHSPYFIKVCLFVCLVSFTLSAIRFFGKMLIREPDKDRNLTFSDSDSQGSARWMDESHFDVLFDNKAVPDTENIILGHLDEKNAGKAEVDRSRCVSINEKGIENQKNRNFFIVGSQGSWKTNGYVLPFILQGIKRGCSMFVTDPKGEIYEKTSNYARENGVKVFVWNTKSPENSDPWNCLAEAIPDGSNSSDMDIFCSTIIENTADGNEEKFYKDAAKLLLMSLCYYVISPENKVGDATFATVFKLLSQKSAQELEFMISVLPPEHLAKQTYMMFQKAEKIKGNTILSLAARLILWMNPEVRRMTSVDGIDLTSLGKEHTIIYMITSDQDSTRDVLNTLFTSFLFIKLIKYADSLQGQKLDREVHFVLDEFCNLGIIPDFCKKLGTVRSRGVGISIIAQSVSQLQNRFPDGQADEIINGCHWNLFLRCSDLITTKYYSELIGTGTVETDMTSKNKNTFRLTEYTRQTQYRVMQAEREVMKSDELRRLGSDELILIADGQNPLRLKKYNFFKDSRGKKIMDDPDRYRENANNHHPETPYEDRPLASTTPGGMMGAQTSAQTSAHAPVQPEQPRICPNCGNVLGHNLQCSACLMQWSLEYLEEHGQSQTMAKSAPKQPPVRTQERTSVQPPKQAPKQAPRQVSTPHSQEQTDATDSSRFLQAVRNSKDLENKLVGQSASSRRFSMDEEEVIQDDGTTTHYVNLGKNRRSSG